MGHVEDNTYALEDLYTLVEPPLSPLELSCFCEGHRVAQICNPSLPGFNKYSMHPTDERRLHKAIQNPKYPRGAILQILGRSRAFYPRLAWQLATEIPFQSGCLSPAYRKRLACWCEGYIAGIDLELWELLAGQHRSSLLGPFMLLSSSQEIVLMRHHPLEVIRPPRSEKKLSPKAYRIAEKAAIQKLPIHIIQVFDFWRVQGLLRPACAEKVTRTLSPTAPCPCLSASLYGACCGVPFDPEEAIDFLATPCPETLQ